MIALAISSDSSDVSLIGSVFILYWIQLAINYGVAFTWSYKFISHCWCNVLYDGVYVWSNWFISCKSFVILVGLQWRCCWNLLLSTMSICLMSSMLSSCDITGNLGSITLSGDTFICNLSDVTVIVTLGGATVGTSLGLTFVLVLFVWWGCILLHSVANLLMSCNWLSLIVKGVLGPGFLIICIN